MSDPRIYPMPQYRDGDETSVIFWLFAVIGFALGLAAGGAIVLWLYFHGVS